jgi:hypothetical protein
MVMNVTLASLKFLDAVAAGGGPRFYPLTPGAWQKMLSRVPVRPVMPGTQIWKSQRYRLAPWTRPEWLSSASMASGPAYRW